jgi:hypothetical protein
MDNLVYHQTAEVARRIAAAGAVVRNVPAYRPNLNPIERMLSKSVAALREVKASTVETLIAARGEPLRPIRPGDIIGWFALGGFPPPESTARTEGKPL